MKLFFVKNKFVANKALLQYIPIANVKTLTTKNQVLV